MPSTTGYRFGDVVLVPFPFTDQSAVKRRPAVVVSSERYNRERADLVIMAITSQARFLGMHGEISVAEWQDAGLLKPSAVKPVITTLQQSLVIRLLGRFKEMDQAALRKALSAIIG